MLGICRQKSKNRKIWYIIPLLFFNERSALKYQIFGKKAETKIEI